MAKLVNVDGKEFNSDIPENVLQDIDGQAIVGIKYHISFLFMTGYGVMEEFNKKEDAEKRLDELNTLLTQKKEEIPMFISINGEPHQVEMIQCVIRGQMSNENNLR